MSASLARTCLNETSDCNLLLPEFAGQTVGNATDVNLDTSSLPDAVVEDGMYVGKDSSEVSVSVECSCGIGSKFLVITLLVYMFAVHCVLLGFFYFSRRTVSS